MSQILRLRGRSALSAFRLRKLVASCTTAVPAVSLINAEFRHFVQVARDLSSDEMARLDRILTYGPAGAAGDEQGELMLVVPRIGTISPWSSKATEIARHCRLEPVQRIERGVAYFVSTRTGRPLSSADRVALAPLIHDRMTETVLGSLEDVVHALAL